MRKEARGKKGRLLSLHQEEQWRNLFLGPVALGVDVAIGDDGRIPWPAWIARSSWGLAVSFRVPPRVSGMIPSTGDTIVNGSRVTLPPQHPLASQLM